MPSRSFRIPGFDALRRSGLATRLRQLLIDVARRRRAQLVLALLVGTILGGGLVGLFAGGSGSHRGPSGRPADSGYSVMDHHHGGDHR